MSEKYSNDRSLKINREKALMDMLTDMYPEEDRQHIETIAGINIVVCGSEPNPDHIKTLKRGMKVLKSRFGKDIIKKAFAGVTTYLVADTNSIGGGKALPRQDAVLLDSRHMDMTVSEMEDMASKRGLYRKGDQSRIFGEDSDASEIGFVHELGHILEFRAHGDVGVGFANIARETAPTWYGQTKGAHEDYAESWMFLAYGHQITLDRELVLRDDLSQLDGK